MMVKSVKNIPAILLLTIFSLVAITARVYPQLEPKYGYLKIETDSSGIEIQLSDKLLGRTPLPIISLVPGNYVLTALHPLRYWWGNLDWQEQITIIPAETLIIEPQFKTILSIQSQPFDADVFLNEEFQGKTPLVIAVRFQDTKQLLIKKDGYQDYPLDPKIIEKGFVNVQLTQNQKLRDLKLFEKNRQQLKNRYRKLTYTLWGVSLLMGLATIHLKDQADQNYRQYLTAGSLSDMNKYYRQSQKYDQYSYVALGAVQVCFVCSFYSLMKSLN